MSPLDPPLLTLPPKPQIQPSTTFIALTQYGQSCLSHNQPLGFDSAYPRIKSPAPFLCHIQTLHPARPCTSFSRVYLISLPNFLFYIPSPAPRYTLNFRLGPEYIYHLNPLCPLDFVPHKPFSIYELKLSMHPHFFLNISVHIRQHQTKEVHMLKSHCKNTSIIKDQTSISLTKCIYSI